MRASWGWGSEEEEVVRFEVDNGRGGWKKVNQTPTTPPDDEEEGWLRLPCLLFRSRFLCVWGVCPAPRLGP